LARGAGNNGPVSTATASSFLNVAGTMGRVTISERIEAAQRERRVLARVFPCRVAVRSVIFMHTPGFRR